MDIRPYDPADADALWELKRGFELGLGTGTGDDDKRAKYEGKLTDQYREEWLGWVADCIERDERCITVADAGGGGGSVEGAGSGPDPSLVGYVFVLPQYHRFIWDAAVLNEIYVGPEHRGSGVADDLMTAAVEVARDQDLPLDRLVLDVDRENERARGFYERHGFEHWGEMVAREL